MDDQRVSSTHYAVLIGIDAYPVKPLQSCVNDVRAIKEYLQGALDSVHLQMLTAATSESAESSSLSAGPITLPTYDNVTSALDEIISIGKPGDFVYIHFSGHGTRVEVSSEFSNRATGDLALDLLQGTDGNEIRYLRGLELAYLLKQMVDKGFKVTLVLDCCFSASVLRDDDDSGIRYLPYNVKVDSKYPPRFEKSLQYEADQQGYRHASMLPNWLVSPDRYAILAACGPGEEAAGLRIWDIGRRGALSYFLHRILTERGGLKKPLRDIYHHLYAKFRELRPQQNPVLYGNKDQGFFGQVDLMIEIPSVPIIKTRESRLQLQAGQAHGVSKGDQFRVYPLGLAGRESAVAMVNDVRGLTSDLELLGNEQARVQTGWIANTLTKSSLQNYRIRLATSIPCRDELSLALRKRSLNTKIDVDKQPHSFHIILDEGSQYAILDESDQRISSLRNSKYDQKNVSQVCDIIEHLANFRLIKDVVENASANPLRSSFSIQITLPSGVTYPPGQLIEVENDTIFKLTVQNSSTKDLYIHPYYMGPQWQVQNLLRGSYDVLPAKDIPQGFPGVWSKKIKMSIPSELKGTGQNWCRDILKIFLTSGPVSFDLLELPKLGEPVRRKRMGKLGKEYNVDAEEDWAALNFPIYTYTR